MNKKIRTINTYNRNAAAMAKKFNAMEGYLPEFEETFSVVEQKENPKVVEIGSGSGRDARDILKYTEDYLGFDISAEMVKRAKKFVPKGNFVVADAESFAFPKNIDAVFAFASLLHCDKKSLAKILEKVHAALKEEGVIFISLKFGDYEEITKTDEFGTRTFYYYTPEIIEELAGKKFKTVFKKRKSLRGQEWFNILLRK